MRSTHLIVAVLLAASPAFAQDLMELLAKGPVVLVEANKTTGKFDRATAVVHIKRPASAVWKTALDFAHYKDFMPKLVKSDPKPMGENRVDLSCEVEVPGTNTVYTFRYDIDPTNMKMHGQWIKGDIKGSFCDWRIVPLKDETLFYYTAASRNFSALAEGLDDEQQTVTVGVNVTAALAVVKAVKSRVESAPTVQRAP